MDSWRRSFESWLKEIAPIANEIDSNPQQLKIVLQQMGDRSWLALKAPSELGGMGFDEPTYRRLQISLARISGALTFLQTQHQSAVSKLASSENKALHSEFFPDVACGNPLVGVGFSHLRRRGIPMVQATETERGYLISGKVPWITGYGFFSYFILGATLADGKELYGILPLQNMMQTSGGKIVFSPPMQLLAAAATNTVSAQIDRWYLSSDRVVSINPAGTIHQTSKKNILNHGFYALGCAYAGLDLLQNIAASKQLEFLHSSWQSLQREAEVLKEQAIASVSNFELAYEQKLQLRSETINLAQRSSLAAVTASSGAANYLYSSAGRVYREALLFSVSGQTIDVMRSSLKHLI